MIVQWMDVGVAKWFEGRNGKVSGSKIYAMPSRRHSMDTSHAEVAAEFRRSARHAFCYIGGGSLPLGSDTVVEFPTSGRSSNTIVAGCNRLEGGIGTFVPDRRIVGLMLNLTM